MNVMESARTILRNLDRWRRKKVSFIEHSAYQMISNKKLLLPHRLPPSQIKKILVVRNNRRIGNIIFLMYFIKQLQDAYPSAQIDLMLRELWQKQFFEHLGISHFYYSPFRVIRIFRFPGFIAKMRKTHYDMVIAPYGSSTDQLFVALAAAKNKVSIASETNKTVCPHSVERLNQHTHYAQQPIEILEALGHKPNYDCHPLIQFNDTEHQQADAIIEALNDDPKKLMVAFFRGARGKKIISDNDWSWILDQFEQRFSKQLVLVEILSPDIKAPLRENTSVYHSASLRSLSAVLSKMDLFISGDTGPLHLAAAAGARCFGLFTHSNPEDYGCLNEASVNIVNIASINDHMDAIRV